MHFGFIRRFYSCNVKNLNKKSCVNCLYFIEFNLNKPELNALGRCNKFAEQNLVTGEIHNIVASDSRYNENMCGKNAKYFTPLKMKNGTPSGR